MLLKYIRIGLLLIASLVLFVGASCLTALVIGCGIVMVTRDHDPAWLLPICSFSTVVYLLYIAARAVLSKANAA